MSFMKSQFRRLVAYFLVIVHLLSFTIGCGRDNISGSGASTSTAQGLLGQINLGEEVFKLVRHQLSLSRDRATEKVAAFDGHHDAFVAAINDILNLQNLSNLGETAKAVFSLVDDGTLPTMTEDIAAILEMLVDDPADPNKETLQALLDLAQARTILHTDDVVAFMGRFLNFKEYEKFMTALATLIKENDGVDDAGNPNGERDLVGEVLQYLSTALRNRPSMSGTPAPVPGFLDEVVEELLKDAVVCNGANLGAPSWAVRADKFGNPAVRLDPATGTLYPPFIDADVDGAADVDARGRPVDANGNVIDIPPFGRGPDRDTHGRALAPGGGLLYRYFDSKRTFLGLLLKIAGDGARKRIHGHLLQVLNCALGAKVRYDNGTPNDLSDDYDGYSAGNPLLDLEYGVLDLFKYPEVPKLLRALENLVNRDPKKSERVLVSLGCAVEKIRTMTPASSGGSGSSGSSYALANELLPLLDEVFETKGTGPSTARTLMDVTNRLGRSARELPHELALLMRYKKVFREQAPDGDSNDIDEARSILVDYSLPPGGDNRSCVEQLLALVGRTNQCTFFGNNLAEMMISNMADLSPSTVSSLISVLNALPNFVPNLFCSGVSQDLQSLDALAASGALDAFLPIAKAFKDKGETRLLVEILVKLDQNRDVMRRAEPTLIEVLESGAVEGLFDVIGEMTTVQVPGTGEVVADVVADAIANLVDDDRVLYGRGGVQVKSLAHMLLDPLKEIDARAQAAGAGDRLEALFLGLTDCIVERAINDNGTPNDPSDDYEGLQNQSLIPFLARVLSMGAAHIPADPQQRTREIQNMQRDMEVFVTGRDFAMIVDIGNVMDRSPSADHMNAAVIEVLTPKQTAADDVFGALLKILVTGLQAKVDTAPMGKIMDFLARLLDPSNKHVPSLIKGFEKLITKDRGKVVLSVLRNTFNPPGRAGADAPVNVMFRVWEDVGSAGLPPGSSGVPNLAQAEEGIRALIRFCRDKNYGAGRIFAYIKARGR
jgi:hypothetical protein